MRKLLNAARVIAAIGLTCLPAQHALSMTVSPLTLEMSVSGSSSRAALRVTNDSNKPAPFEVQVYRLTVDQVGNQNTIPASGDFVIAPLQFIVKPGGSQTVRVQWTGRADLKMSQSYIIAVNQIPVKFEKASGVQLVFNFAVVANVAPPGGSSTLALKATALTKDGIKFTVANSGNRHASIADASLDLRATNFGLTISGSKLQQIFGLGLVQPGQERTFLIPSKSVQIPPNVAALQGTLDYQPKAEAGQ